MTIGGGFRRLTRILRRLEGAGWIIESIEPASGDAFTSSSLLGAVITCRYGEEDSPRPPGVNALELTEHPVDIVHQSLETTPAGVIATLDVSIEMPEENAPTAPTGVSTTPLHQDTERLRSLYRSYPTFSAMADAVDADVSAETIRRYTIEHGIHEPGATGMATQPLMADGMGISAEVTRSEIIDAVAESNTIYGVQEQLGFERSTTTTLLKDLGLIDLVTGRIENVRDQEARQREIRDRLTVTSQNI